MDPALQKTLTFLSFILIGVLLRRKFVNKEQVNGIKTLILTIALPSTIFVALMGSEVDVEMLILPVLALIFNFLIYFISPFLLKIIGVDARSQKGRTLRLLLPSLAPGLSCFPFILEYLGEASLADAALADVGNKFFVLIFLYIMAMNIYYRLSGAKEKSSKGKIKELLISLVREPINLIIIFAIILLSVGINFENLPVFLSDTFLRLSLIMTPLVLFFIGLAVKLKKDSLWPIMNILLIRSGITLLISTGFIALTGITDTNMILLAIVFPLSSCSFWPFAHLSLFNKKSSGGQKPFDTEYAILILALSLPISTVLILGVLSSGSFFANTTVSGFSGVILLGIVLLGQLIKKWLASSFNLEFSTGKRFVEQTD